MSSTLPGINLTAVPGWVWLIVGVVCAALAFYGLAMTAGDVEEDD